MILTLLSCFSTLQANEFDSVPFTGDVKCTDSCIVVPISFIRNANDKLVEREYLLKVVETQDTIINLKEDYILYQDTIIQDLKNRIVEANKINENLQKQYKKERTKKIIYGTAAGACLVATLTSIITISVMKK